MKIITYPHSTLRYTSKAIRRVDAELKRMVREMFDLMYQAEGVGLAANQVDLPLRLFIVNLEAQAGKGEEYVFINPVISRPKGSEESQEGCLSLPGLYGQVIRPKEVRINAYSLTGQEIQATLTGLFARVVQHELDHLDGVLFPDRMSETAKADLASRLEEFEIDFNSRRSTGEVPTDEDILARRKEWEQKYC